MSEQTQVCKKCGKTLPLSAFYTHITCVNGHVGQCKECFRIYKKERYAVLRLNPRWFEQEAKRKRETQRGTDWKNIPPTYEQQKESRIKYRKQFPEKYHAAIACQQLVREKGFVLHHWSYNTDHQKDVISMNTRQHGLVHRFMLYDQERMMYRRMDGTLIDSREAAIAYYATLKDDTPW